MAMGHVEMSADAWRCRCVAMWQHGDRFLTKTKTKQKKKTKSRIKMLILIKYREI